jgi:hypothetical protein
MFHNFKAQHSFALAYIGIRNPLIFKCHLFNICKGKILKTYTAFHFNFEYVVVIKKALLTLILAAIKRAHPVHQFISTSIVEERGCRKWTHMC